MNIRELRLKAGLTQVELAKVLGCTVDDLMREAE